VALPLELTADLADERADDLELVEVKLRSNRDNRVHQAAAIMEASPDGRLPDEEFRRFRSAVSEATRYQDELDTLAKLRKESRGLAAVVKREPRQYGPSNPRHSFFADLADYMLQTPNYRAAEQRLMRHGKEVGIEARNNPLSPEGQRARRVLREYTRCSNTTEHRHQLDETETRAMSSTSTSGGSFVTPQYVVDLWASYRGPARAFADQCRSVPLPEYGLEVYLPSMTGPAAAGAQTENSGLDETDPTGVYLSASLETIAGLVTVSQQLYDRGGQDGLGFDEIVGAQIKEQLDAQIDNYVLTQALANAGTVTDSSTGSITTLYTDVAAAREKLTDTAGTRLQASHLFTTSDLFGWATRQVDSSGRPILTPDSGAIVAAQAMGDPAFRSWSGVHLGQCRWHLDDNIPAVSGNTQLVVARPAEVFVWEGEPIPQVTPETGATTLSVVISLRSYVAAIPRYQKAVAVIGGSAYPTSLV